MMRLTFVAVVIISVASCAVAQNRAMYAAHASVGDTAQSPDRNVRVSLRLLDENADDFPTEVKVSTNGRTMTSRIKFGLNTEILWSKDSRAFSITGSSGGANGQYHTDVFFIRSDRLVHVRLTPLIETAFGHPVKCGWREAPNVAAVKWLNDSATLLVAAEIVSHSNCDSMGTFKGYVVDVQDHKVVKTYDQITVKRLFGTELGEELKNANDSCIRSPRSCYVSTNHPELRSKEQ